MILKGSVPFLQFLHNQCTTTHNEVASTNCYRARFQGALDHDNTQPGAD